MHFFLISCADQNNNILGTWRHIEGSLDSGLEVTFYDDGKIDVSYRGNIRTGKYKFDGKSKIDCAGENGKYETYLLKNGKIYIGGSYPYVLEKIKK